MDKPVGKAPASPGVVATAEAGPVLLVKKRGRFCSLPEEEIFYPKASCDECCIASPHGLLRK